MATSAIRIQASSKSALKSDAFGFKGLIDDVQLYSTALSAANITTLFENPGVALAEPIIEGWPWW